MHNKHGNDARHWNLTRDALIVTKKQGYRQLRLTSRKETEDLTLQFELVVSQSTNCCCSLKDTRSSQKCAVPLVALSLDVLSPIDSLCIGHFSCLDHQHRRETQGSTCATAGTEIKRTQEPRKTPPTIQHRDTHQDQR